MRAKVIVIVMLSIIVISNRIGDRIQKFADDLNDEKFANFLIDMNANF